MEIPAFKPGFSKEYETVIDWPLSGNWNALPEIFFRECIGDEVFTRPPSSYFKFACLVVL
jgi:hypothetical protein